MVQRPTDRIEDKETRLSIESLQEESAEKALILDAAPTATAPLLEDGSDGFYSGSLYKRRGSTIYVFTADSTITIT